MNEESTKQQIFKTAFELLNNSGGKDVTLRQVSAKSGVSLGSIYHFYPKKEDLYIAVHTEITNIVYSVIQSHNLVSHSPWIDYLYKHYIYLSWSTSTLQKIKGFVYSTTFPSSRRHYVETINELFLKSISPDEIGISKWNIFLSCTVLSGAEFELISLYAQRANELNFDDLIRHAFLTQLCMLGVEKDQAETLVRESIDQGKTLLEVIKTDLDNAVYGNK